MHSRICLTLILFLFAAPAFAQNAPALPPPRHPTPDLTPPSAEEEDARSRMTHEMEKRAAKERAASLRSDTEKLLRLSTELKAYVEKSNENVLSLDVIKKAEEIEKLAKSVKDKMKGPN